MEADACLCVLERNTPTAAAACAPCNNKFTAYPLC